MEKLKYISRHCSTCLQTQKFWEQRDGTYECDLCGHKMYKQFKRDSPEYTEEE